MLRIVFNVLILVACLQGQSSLLSAKLKATTLASGRKIYANPYHPEDDNITGILGDFMSDEDGDNLHSIRGGQLSESEKKIVKVKRLKVNGRYYTVGTNTARTQSEELWSNIK